MLLKMNLQSWYRTNSKPLSAHLFYSQGLQPRKSFITITRNSILPWQVNHYFVVESIPEDQAAFERHRGKLRLRRGEVQFRILLQINEQIFHWICLFRLIIFSRVRIISNSAIEYLCDNYSGALKGLKPISYIKVRCHSRRLFNVIPICV